MSTALVLMMSVPALALFYGGMVRSKNMLSMLMQVFVVFSLITVLWCVYGYSLAFTEGNAFFGGFDRLFLKGTLDASKGEFAMAATFSKGVVIPELVFVAFQATFAAITCCLILGAFAERAKFSAVLVFMVLWFTFGYAPIAHMVWFWMGPDAYTDREARRRAERQGRPDLAVGRARLRGRHGGAHQRRCRRPGGRLHGRQAHRLRQGSDDAAQPADDDDRRLAAVVRLVRLQRRLRARGRQLRRRSRSSTRSSRPPARCSRGRSCEWMFKGKPSMLGAASGAVAGLVAITPAAGNVGIPGAFVIGIAAGVVCLWGVAG